MAKQRRQQNWPPANMNPFYQFNNSNGGAYSMHAGVPGVLPPPLPPSVQLSGGVPVGGTPYGAPFLPIPPQAFFRPQPAGAQEPTGPRTAQEVFGALATWTDLPDPSTVEAVYVVDLTSLLHTPAPNLDLMDSKSAKLIESGIERASWYDRADVLEQVIAESRWNEALVDVVLQINKVPNSVLVIQTSRILDHTPLIQNALKSKGLRAHMFAHTDYSQAQKTRKHQLIQRLWHYYPACSMVYYESPSSHRETKDLNNLLQRLATVDRALPMLFEVHNPRSNIDPSAERRIIEQILEDVPSLEAQISPDRWVWRIKDYNSIVGALGETGNDEIIVDYLGRHMDYDSDAMPVVGDRGKTRTLRATKLVIAGPKISLVFENEHTLPVASLKQRAVDTIWPVDFEVEMVLDMIRSITIRKVEEKSSHSQDEMSQSHPETGLIKEEVEMEPTGDVAPAPKAPTASPKDEPEEESSSGDGLSSTSSSSTESESDVSEYLPHSDMSP